MAKTLAADILTQLAARQRTPILLFEFYLDSGTLYLARTISNVRFPNIEGGTTYTAKAIEIGSLSQSAEGQIQGVTVNIDDISGQFRILHAGGENFQWKKLIIKRVYNDALTDADNYYEFFNGYIDKVGTVSRMNFELGASVGSPLDVRMMNWFYQKTCQWRFGDLTRCQVDLTTSPGGNPYTATGTATSGTTATLSDNSIDTPLINSIAQYWKYAKIEVTIGTNVYKRMVASHDTNFGYVTFDVALPEAVTDETTYTIVKGCDHTYATCKAENNWGPASDNSSNYGGFLHVPVGPKEQHGAYVKWVRDPNNPFASGWKIYRPQ